MMGDNTAMPSLDTVSQIVTLHAGDQVVSSGDGGLLPPGLPIGTVVEQGGKCRVALLADAARARMSKSWTSASRRNNRPATVQTSVRSGRLAAGHCRRRLPAVAAPAAPASTAKAKAPPASAAPPQPSASPGDQPDEDR